MMIEPFPKKISPTAGGGFVSHERTTNMRKNKPLSIATARSSLAATRAVVQEFSDLLPHPHPSLSATDVVSACMSTFIDYNKDLGLQVCFAFSSDRCRAAMGGSLDEFLQYADNPTFGYLVHCQSWDICSVGPVIPGTSHRGAMQTVLMVARPSSTTASSSASSSRSAVKSMPFLDDDEATTQCNQQQMSQVEDCGRPFLWTLQMERRPPLQGCWMVHEVLYTPNAYWQTL